MSKIGNYLEFHAQALNLRSRRNEILASNIANAATPHFKARDLNFEQEIQRHIKHGPLRVTNDVHFPTNTHPLREQMLFRDPINPLWMVRPLKWLLSRWNSQKMLLDIKQLYSF